jgi:hypothetical protein
MLHKTIAKGFCKRAFTGEDPVDDGDVVSTNTSGGGGRVKVKTTSQPVNLPPGALSYVSGHEGYLPTPKHIPGDKHNVEYPTIGYGFHMHPDNMKWLNTTSPALYQAVMSGRVSKPQALQLLKLRLAPINKEIATEYPDLAAKRPDAALGILDGKYSGVETTPEKREALKQVFTTGNQQEFRSYTNKLNNILIDGYNTRAAEAVTNKNVAGVATRYKENADKLRFASQEYGQTNKWVSPQVQTTPGASQPRSSSALPTSSASGFPQPQKPVVPPPAPSPSKQMKPIVPPF